MSILALFALSAVYMFMRILRARKKAGVRGMVRSQDLDGKGSRVYRNHKVGISAKPDVVEGGRVIEYKSAHVNHKPRRSDLHQVAAEMIAADMPEAELRYGNDKRFRLTKHNPETRKLKKEVIQNSEHMRRHLSSGKAPKGTPTRGKCSKCPTRRECSDAM